ncbi:MAG: phosphate ABC transporter permease PstA [Acetobacter sp.]|jgi:phosphate transport system permease protein|nr:phosphate ABC transporter permease PstA [Acetobacter sp.]MCH4062368.1 phosphate ABC transporter permease PstA [Acetobacter sp.]MCH4088785.1 phosphate ABC transporter permease PstA [Acetobacter sp.]MCI1292690.1 phosphate ABC transporter permease PstA [Acetobacter sp.]MCI1319210.1 phosphate ABC transporter permease PstA [Acetobacter sp.]
MVAGGKNAARDGWTSSGRLAMRRRLTDRIATILSYAATAVSIIALSSILWTLLVRGLPGLSLITFTHSTASPGMQGGLANAIIGSIIQTVLSIMIGAPLGLLCGIYLADYGRGPLSQIIRFVSDMLLSAPSILIGLFIYQLLVVPTGHFSGYAGALALAILALPIVVRTTEDMLRLVPVSMREAGIALGAAKWRVTLFICLRAAQSGVMTGILLAVARVSGETAPLLFTSLGNLDWSVNPAGPMASLPVTIYQYAGSSYDDWVQLAWTGALLVTFGVLAINIAVRTGFGRNRT